MEPKKSSAVAVRVMWLKRVWWNAALSNDNLGVMVVVVEISKFAEFWYVACHGSMDDDGACFSGDFGWFGRYLIHCDGCEGETMTGSSLWKMKNAQLSNSVGSNASSVKRFWERVRSCCKWKPYCPPICCKWQPYCPPICCKWQPHCPPICCKSKSHCPRCQSIAKIVRV